MRRDPFKEIIDLLVKAFSKRGETSEVMGLLPPARAMVMARLCQEVNAPILIVTRDEETAREFHRDLMFFWPVENGRGLYFYPYLRAGFMAQETHVQRMEALEGLCRRGEGPVAMVAPLSATFQSAPSKEMFLAHVIDVSCGDTLDRDHLSRLLSEAGYSRVDMVEEVGDYSVRGGIIDVFPPLSENPVRIEFFGDTIESIREFGAEDQLSIRKVEEIRVVPVKEPVSTEWASDGPTSQHAVGTIFQYLGPGGVIVLDEADLIRETLEAGQPPDDYREEVEASPVSARPRYVHPGLIKEAFQKAPLLELTTLPLDEKSRDGAYVLISNGVTSFRSRFSAFIEELKNWMAEGYSALLVSHNEYQARRMKALLGDYDLGAKIYGDLRELSGNGLRKGSSPWPPLAICIGSLSSGFEFPATGLVVITELEVFGAARKAWDKARRKTGKLLSDFRDLRVGDYVVHVDYGIGQYLGMSGLAINGRTSEFLKIQYAEGEYLYVPVESLNLVQKYIGSGAGQPPLDRLGSSSWKRKKANVKESVRKLAKDLLELYAAREMIEGYSYSPDNHWHQEFDSAFEYEETPDQLKAIEEVKADMERSTPMDRLICGDVGYGKTEVAMRASFKAVMDSRQVAVLVPTTILAHQHFNTFSRRFAPYPATVEMLSRFKSPTEQRAIVEGLANGTIDVVIGTHRLLQKDIQFKNLGLVVVDEEQRFGVRHKERLKKLRKAVDVLTLTATPIPRTLYLSLMGARDLSIIDTPPEGRLSIETHLARFNDQAVRAAILMEVGRGGQVYFVHNRVGSIEAMRKYLRKLVPEARVGVAHGQLWEHSLEDVMIRFLNKEFDILLATSIIESGLDIPSVNTIIINRADRFGLAQLYQLRGRVGRDKYKAQAYLLVPAKDAITDVARQRLKAVQELTELGSGFHLATRDMEIRGAGNILGSEQSGHIATVGFDLYCRLIEETIQELRGEEYQEEVETEIDLGFRGIIPQEYVTDTNLRLMIYKKLSSLREIEELNSYARELEDRYGKLPHQMFKLLEYFEIKIMARKLKVERLKIDGEKCFLTFHKSTPLDPGVVIDLVKRKGRDARFVSDTTIQIKLYDGHCENVFIYLKKELQNFITHDNLSKKRC